MKMNRGDREFYMAFVSFFLAILSAFGIGFLADTYSTNFEWILPACFLWFLL